MPALFAAAAHWSLSRAVGLKTGGGVFGVAHCSFV
jgi:hypothetical protein